MHKLLAVAALLAAAPIVLAIAPAGAGGIATPPSAAGAGAGDHAIVLVGGMGGAGGGMGGSPSGMGGSPSGMGGSPGGMGGSPGGMGGGSPGGMGGSPGGMGGGHTGYGSMFGGPTTDSGRPAEALSRSGGQSDNYTYRCVTASGLCPFVAPAALRATSLRSGADCFCADGRTRGRVE